jgi:hypothetical protein
MFASRKGHTVVSVIEDEYEGEKYTSYVMSPHSVAMMVDWVMARVAIHVGAAYLVYLLLRAWL